MQTGQLADHVCTALAQHLRAWRVGLHEVAQRHACVSEVLNTICRQQALNKAVAGVRALRGVHVNASTPWTTSWLSCDAAVNASTFWTTSWLTCDAAVKVHQSDKHQGEHGFRFVPLYVVSMHY